MIIIMIIIIIILKIIIMITMIVIMIIIIMIMMMIMITTIKEAIIFIKHVSAVCFRFPPSTHPVMAFTGAPAAFPVREADATLHRYLKWSDHINYQADKIINEQIVQRPYLAIHMRNGIDWVRSCL